MAAQSMPTTAERCRSVSQHSSELGVERDVGRSDDEVMADAQRDPAAFGTIFERHYDDILRYASRSLPLDVAEDCASETFVIALKKRSSYKPGRGTARPWLFGICLRLVSDARRKSARSSAGQRRLYVVEDVNTPNHADCVDEKADADAAYNQLLPCLEALSKADRQVLELYAWADMTYTDIANTLKVPVGTVRSRLNRARKKLHKAALAQSTAGHREAK